MLKNEIEHVIDNNSKALIEPLLLNSLSYITNLETKFTTEEIQEALKDKKKIDHIIDLFPNLDETLRSRYSTI